MTSPKRFGSRLPHRRDRNLRRVVGDVDRGHVHDRPHEHHIGRDVAVATRQEGMWSHNRPHEHHIGRDVAGEEGGHLVVVVVVVVGDIGGGVVLVFASCFVVVVGVGIGCGGACTSFSSGGGGNGSGGWGGLGVGGGGGGPDPEEGGRHVVEDSNKGDCGVARDEVQDGCDELSTVRPGTE